MQKAEVVLGVLRERGRRGLPCAQLYRQMFNKDLYLMAYGNIYSNQGAMTPGASRETADGMSEDKIEQITGLMRRERYRFVSIHVPCLWALWSDGGLRARRSRLRCGRGVVTWAGGGFGMISCRDRVAAAGGSA